MTPIFAARLQQHHDVPMTPSNADRYLEFLREYGPTIGNGYFYARPSSLHNRPATPPDAGAGSTYTNVPGA